jgi:SAM-dependent methyltransferase
MRAGRIEGGHGAAPPSEWVNRFEALIPEKAQTLDLACGDGRHTRLLLDRGHPMVAVDRDLSGIQDLAGHPHLECLEVDLEDGCPFLLAGRQFGGVVVTNYLYRPIMRDIVAAVGPGGVLIYETFAKGNESFGKPSRPEFLLQRGELLEVVRGELVVVAYEDLVVNVPKPAAVQRIAAVRAKD